MKNNNPFYVYENCLLIYETKEEASRPGRASAMHSSARSTWQNKELRTKITYSNPQEPIFVIKKENLYWNVIVGERIGWIIAEKWHNTKNLEK
jgi:hypothetical protein